jgi:predicted ATPase
LLGVVEGADPLAQMDGQLKQRRTLEAIKRILVRESLNQPLMVIFEDLHWIDEATQEFLNLLADSLGTAKLLLLVNYRPEYSHRWNRIAGEIILRKPGGDLVAAEERFHEAITIAQNSCDSRRCPT